jgi:hypothetical protein
LDTEIGWMLAVVTRAGISSLGRMATTLQELMMESPVHLGRLNFEEMCELITTMGGAAVALGDRNKNSKLRMLAKNSRWDSFSSFGSQGVHRARQGGQDESVANKQRKMQAKGRVETTEPSGG